MVKRKNKNIIIILKRISLVFALLFTFIFIFGNNVINILGFEKIDYINNQNKQIIIDKDIINKLNIDYKTTKTERVYCLEGREDMNNIYLDEIKEMNDVEMSENRISFNDNSDCKIDKKKFKALLHFHLRSFQIKNYGAENCNPSINDMFNYGYMSSVYPSLKLNMIMCNKNKILIQNYEEENMRGLRWQTN